MLRVVSDLDLFVAFGHIEVVVNGVSHIQSGLANILVLSTLWDGGFEINGLLLDVHLVQGDAIVAQSIKIGLEVVEPSQLGDAHQVGHAFRLGVAVQFI